MRKAPRTSDQAVEGSADVFEAEVRPREKFQRIQTLQKKGGTIHMVGDGINDTLALADVILASGSLQGIVRASISAGPPCARSART